jgi:alkylated DNA repair dioxygenase AlkB
MATRSSPTSEFVPSSTTLTHSTVAAASLIERMCDRLARVGTRIQGVQGSLFEHSERRQLGDGAFIEIRAGWLSDADDALTELLAIVPWRTERRQMYDRVVDVPRLVSFHDLTTDEPPHPLLPQLRRRLNDIYAGELGEPFTTVGLCCYRDGSDSVAWHGDTIGRSSSEDTMVAIVSLGQTRTFALRRRGGGPSLRLPLAHGDLLVMGGSCQRTWEHAVPKTSAPAGPRVSIQFRPRDVR